MTKKTKIFIIIGIALLISGVIIVALGIGIYGIERIEFTEKTVEFEAADKISIDVDTAELEFYTYDGSEISVTYPDSKEITFDVNVENGVLTVCRKDNRAWYKRIYSVYGNDCSIRIAIPKSNTIFGIDAELTTGSAVFTDVTVAGSIEYEASTGSVSLKNVKADSIDLCLTTGSIEIYGVECNSFSSEASTGKAKGNGIKCQALDIETTTGSISIESIQADKIALRTSTGSINGSIIGDKKDYTISASAKTGSNNLMPQEGMTDKTLNVKATTGSIDIDFIS